MLERTPAGRGKATDNVSGFERGNTDDRRRAKIGSISAPISAACARQRRRRERSRRGCASYHVEVGAEVLDMLIRTGWLRDGDATDPRRVARAIAALLEDSASR
jgi:hypothetical protein